MEGNLQVKDDTKVARDKRNVCVVFEIASRIKIKVSANSHIYIYINEHSHTRILMYNYRSNISKLQGYKLTASRRLDFNLIGV